MPGFVYLFARNGLHKIGRSKKPAVRLTQCARGGTVVHLIPSENPCQVEKALHARLASSCVRGEWFRLSKEDIASICQLGRVDAADELPSELYASGETETVRVKGDLMEMMRFVSACTGRSITSIINGAVRPRLLKDHRDLRSP